ncbi:MAG: hypothetical protein ACM3ZE_23645, partial [Myxococcales bacterium]
MVIARRELLNASLAIQELMDTARAWLGSPRMQRTPRATVSWLCTALGRRHRDKVLFDAWSA